MDAPLQNPAEKLLKAFGSQAEVGRRFKVSPEAVRLWLKKGIPPDRALEVEELTRETPNAITAIEVLVYAKQLRDGRGSQGVQLALPS